MRLLLDTHVLLWALYEPERLSKRGAETLADAHTEVVVSLVSVWEVAIKSRLGKLPVSDVAALLAEVQADARLQLLPVAPGHLLRLERLPVHAAHRDPFDHLLIAQALHEGLVFASRDRFAELYGVPLFAP